MAATFQMPKMVRGARLTPAAPRKTLTENNKNLANIQDGHIPRNSSLASLSDSDIKDSSMASLSDSDIKDSVDSEEKKENTSVFNKEDEIIYAGRKENKPARGMIGGRNGIGAGSRRITKLEKPRPLKTARTENKTPDNLDSNQNEMKSLEQPSDQTSENGRTRQLSPHSAKLTTEKLIQQTLRDINIADREQSGQPQEMSARNRLLSQVSDDSGYGESSAFSRQGSMLESLEECQDDEEWLVVDEIYTTDAGEEVYKKGPLYRHENSSTWNRLPTGHHTANPDNNREPQGWVKWNDAVLDHLQKQQKNELVNLKSNAIVIHVCEDECEEYNAQVGKTQLGKQNRGSDIGVIHVCEDDCDAEYRNSDIPYLKPVDRDIPHYTARQDSACYPDDLDMIEMELQSLRGELGDSCLDKSLEVVEERQSRESSKENREGLSWINELKKKPREIVVVREPITPLTLLKDVFKIEANMPGGVYSAKGRRRMFRSHATVRQEEEALPPPRRLQYSAEELLWIGCDKVCRVPPESWAYLVETLPLVCLSKNLRYFDPMSYIDERSYVDQHIGYVKSAGPIEMCDRNAPSAEDPPMVAPEKAERLAFNARKNQWTADSWTADSKIAPPGNTTDSLASNDRKWKPYPKAVQENTDNSATNSSKWQPYPNVAQEKSDRSAPDARKLMPDLKDVQKNIEDKPSSARKSLWTPDPSRMEAMKAQEGQTQVRTLRSVMQSRNEQDVSQSVRGFQGSNYKNHSNKDQNTFQKGFLPEVNEVDLDTKCDVRVRNTNKIAGGGPSNGIVPSLCSRSAGLETGFTPKWMRDMRRKSEDTSQWGNNNKTNDDLVNKDLPEHCPW